MSERVALAVELTPAQVRPIAYRVISKKYGLNLKSSALQVLADHLGHKFGSEWRGAKAERFLDEIARLWRDEDRGLFLEGEPLKKLINDLENAAASQQNPQLRTQTMNDSATASIASEPRRRFHWKDYFKVVGAHSQRRFVYNPIHHRYDLGPTQTAQVLGDTNSAVRMVPSRYHILLDRIERSDVFSGRERYLTPIINMIGRQTTHFFIFGLLSKIEGESGSMWLVDSTSRIELEFIPQTQAMGDHYYGEGSFMICEGQLLDGKFIVLSMGPPIFETRLNSKEVFGNIDFLGIMSSSRTHIERIDYSFEQVLAQEEVKSTHHRIMVLGSNLHLDKTQNLDALRLLLRRFEESPPIGIVFMGSFSSVPFQAQNSIAKYTEVMTSLALLLKEFPRICSQTKLIFIPGDNDPWHSSDSEGAPTWPLRPLPDLFTRRVSLAASDTVFTSNPTRVCYLSQEIVVCNDRYGEKFRRHNLSFDWENGSHKQQEQHEEEEVMDLTEERQQETLADTLVDMNLDTDEADRQYALNSLVQGSQGAAPPKATWTYNSQNEQARKLVATILDQAHLSPFPSQVRPTIWEDEHSLSLAQWPDVLIMADPTSPRFSVTYHGCAAFNPGRFLRAGSVQWLEYVPSTSSGVLMSEKL